MTFFNGIDFENSPVSNKRPRYSYTPADPLVRPCVSIVTPFYNTGAEFAETARSVFNQSLQEWEWIIVNDGSTEPGSLKILDGFRNADPRIRVIDHEKNRGLSAARNTGYHNATAEFILQLDSDDLIEPTAVEKLLWALETIPQSSFVSGLTVGFGEQKYLWRRGFHEGYKFLFENVVTATCMVRKHVHKKIGGYDEKLLHGLEDWDFWLRCAEAGYWGHTVYEYLEWYRRRANHGDRWNNIRNQGIRDFRKTISVRYPHLTTKTFPHLDHSQRSDIQDNLPCENKLSKARRGILLIVPWLAMGGADKFNLGLVQHLTARGWNVTIATTLSSEDIWCDEFARYTGDIFMLHRFLELNDYPRFLRYLIASRQPDIVCISNSELGYMLLPYLKSRCPGPAYLDYCHMEEPEWRDGGFPALSVQYRNYLDATMVASIHLKHWIEKRGGDEKRVHLCRINVDTEKWQPDLPLRQKVRRELGIEDNIIVILYAARLCRQKLPLLFAEVLHELAKSGESFVALVAGDGEDKPILTRYIKKYHLEDRIRLLGNLSIDRMHNVMTASDIFFLPSRNEGISLAIYEAMASGLVVVAADVGGQRELVSEGTGILVPPGTDSTSRESYRDTLRWLVNNPEERLRIATAARNRIVNEFDLCHMVSRFEEICRHAANNRRSLSDTAVDAVSIAKQAVQYAMAFDKSRETLSKSELPLNMRLYTLLTRVFGSVYFWCLDNKLSAVIKVKDFLRKSMRIDAS